MVLFPAGGNWGFHGLLVLYLNKDFLNGQSPLKRLLDTQVQETSGAPANEWQSFLRNISVIIWPVEVLVVTVSGGRRLGDYLARTHVADVAKNTNSWRHDLAAHRVTRYTFYTLLATAFYLLLVNALFHWLGL
ncbi:hypothetical protein CLV45_4691 [Hymenobacter chitinivorans DSM 11115]|uniref:Uncharacterized protein n=2 Tax=Hymenobacter chitinivorans TaxID=89969 RepID=A0A2M9AQN2_9BACT|nr:hypothetical protein CLV45_4691 [Hymenobacter chitinivorans DSM 11115]